ncbi:MAG: hypothetical protein COA66_15810 [Arcobacter sp.]|nr:MAG: hypothetical protein COA66_15810 [Arcobacter sp.]
MKNLNFSMKTKSLFFILCLISILLLTLYYQNKSSNKSYLYLLQNNYKNTLDNFYSTFRHKLENSYTNLNFYLENDVLFDLIDEKKNTEIKNYEKYLLTKFKNKNAYLKDINITLITKNKIHFPSYSFTKRKNHIYIKLSYLLKSKKSSYARVDYLLTSKLLLKSVKMYNNSEGVIYFEDKNKNLLETYLEQNRNNETFSVLLENCREEHKDLKKIKDKFYISKILALEVLKPKGEYQAVFFLDVTKEKNEYISLVKNSLIVSLLLFVFAAILVNFYLNYLINRISKNEYDVKQINKNLEKTISIEITKGLKLQQKALEEKQKNEQMLIQQSKLAMMGEMIGNIAHQWRQPLMQLSAIFMYLDAYQEKGKLTPEKFNKKIQDSVSIIDYMSKTIEDFRNYFKPEKQKETFLIKECLDSALFIIDSTLKNSFIEVKTVYEKKDIKTTSFKNEFSQALLNIISNSKDILILRKIQNPLITISVFQKNHKTYISIEDNAKGIDKSILNKIFDPYFTTKHKSSGTGIGLYMSKMIIENSMQGKIFVENTENGAKFTIEI